MGDHAAREELNLEGIINRRMGSKLMGFGAQVKKETERSLGETLREVQPEDLIKFGLIPEFVGRFRLSRLWRSWTKQL